VEGRCLVPKLPVSYQQLTCLQGSAALRGELMRLYIALQKKFCSSCMRRSANVRLREKCVDLSSASLSRRGTTDSLEEAPQAPSQ
jgi:hypothetical protein